MKTGPDFPPIDIKAATDAIAAIVDDYTRRALTVKHGRIMMPAEAQSEFRDRLGKVLSTLDAYRQNAIHVYQAEIARLNGLIINPQPIRIEKPKPSILKGGMTEAAFTLAAATLARLAEGGERTISAHEIATALHAVRDSMRPVTSFDEQAAYQAIYRTFQAAGISEPDRS